MAMWWICQRTFSVYSLESQQKKTLLKYWNYSNTVWSTWRQFSVVASDWFIHVASTAILPYTYRRMPPHRQCYMRLKQTWRLRTVPIDRFDLKILPVFCGWFLLFLLAQIWIFEKGDSAWRILTLSHSYRIDDNWNSFSFSTYKNCYSQRQ